MLLDKLHSFYKDLSEFDQNKPVLVTYNPTDHTLSYHQLGKTVICTYMVNYYFNKSKFKIGVLNQVGLNKLRQNIMDLVANQLMIDGELSTCIGNLSIDFYQFFRTKYYVGPQKIKTLKLVNVTNRFWVWFICNHYSPELKTLYKLLKSQLNSDYERSKSAESK